jgi:hypothetical protein
MFAQRSIVHAWKPTKAEEIHISLWFFMPMGIIQEPSLQSYFCTKRIIATLGFGDITRERLKLPCKFLHFSDNERQNTYQGPQKLFKIFLSLPISIINFRLCTFLTRTFHEMNP